jgi:hypothetical protein
MSTRQPEAQFSSDVQTDPRGSGVSALPALDSPRRPLSPLDQPGGCSLMLWSAQCHLHLLVDPLTDAADVKRRAA